MNTYFLNFCQVFVTVMRNVANIEDFEVWLVDGGMNQNDLL